MPNSTVVPETSTWVSSIYLLETTDPLQGYNPSTDEIGISNLQAQQLGSRTLYLRDKFFISHKPDGTHELRNADFVTNAGIEESKLALDYPTQTLHSLNNSNSNDITLTENRVFNISGVEGSLTSALNSAIPLSWRYAENGFRFEMFVDPTRMMKPINLPLTREVSGDDSIDVADSSKLIVGRSYVIHDGNGNNSEFITIGQILTTSRVLCTQALNITRNYGVVDKTSWLINEDKTATAKHNSLYISDLIDVAENAEECRIIIRRQSNAAQLEVAYRTENSNTWTTVALYKSTTITNSVKDEEYHVGGGKIFIRVKVLCPVESPTCNIYHIAALPNVNVNAVDMVRQPTNVSPANGATNITQPTLVGSNFLGLYGIGYKKAEFQIATDSSFTNTIHAAEVTSGTSYTVPVNVMQPNSVYYWRVRYQNIENTYSKWSVPTAFSTASSLQFIQKPTNVTPASGAVNVSNNVVLSASSFTVINTVDTHALSEWQLATDSEFTNIVHSSGQVSTYLTSYPVPPEVFSTSTTYYWRVRYKGQTLPWSEWSTGTSFTTANVFAKIIGLVMVQSGGGSGTWQRIGSNYEAVTVDSNYFNTHPTYAGIVGETIDSQYMVKIPKFWFNAGTVPSGTYAGKTYWMISDQPVPGFSVHPAFVGIGGTELNQIWVGKYQASASSGKLQSVPGVLPRVSMDFPTARSEAYARNTGGITGFRLWSVYDLSAIQMLATIEMGGLDMQALIGQGRVNATSAAAVDAADVAQASWRGFVGLWGNVLQMVDGIKRNGGNWWRWQYNVPGNTTTSDFSTGYINTGRPALTSSGYPVTFDTTLLAASVIAPATVDGTQTNGSTGDYFWSNTNTTDSIAYHGGSWDYGATAGLFDLYVGYAPSDAYGDIGARLAKV